MMQTTPLRFAACVALRQHEIYFCQLGGKSCPHINFFWLGSVMATLKPNVKENGFQKAHLAFSSHCDRIRLSVALGAHDRIANFSPEPTARIERWLRKPAKRHD
jgi:hypothetical protein